MPAPVCRPLLAPLASAARRGRGVGAGPALALIKSFLSLKGGKGQKTPGRTDLNERSKGAPRPDDKKGAQIAAEPIEVPGPLGAASREPAWVGRDEGPSPPGPGPDEAAALTKVGPGDLSPATRVPSPAS